MESTIKKRQYYTQVKAQFQKKMEESINNNILPNTCSTSNHYQLNNNPLSTSSGVNSLARKGNSVASSQQTHQLNSPRFSQQQQSYQQKLKVGNHPQIVVTPTQGLSTIEYQQQASLPSQNRQRQLAEDTLQYQGKYQPQKVQSPPSIINHRTQQLIQYKNTSEARYQRNKKKSGTFDIKKELQMLKEGGLFTQKQREEMEHNTAEFQKSIGNTTDRSTRRSQDGDNAHNKEDQSEMLINENKQSERQSNQQQVINKRQKIYSTNMNNQNPQGAAGGALGKHSNVVVTSSQQPSDHQNKGMLSEDEEGEVDIIEQRQTTSRQVVQNSEINEHQQQFEIQSKRQQHEVIVMQTQQQYQQQLLLQQQQAHQNNFGEQVSNMVRQIKPDLKYNLEELKKRQDQANGGKDFQNGFIYHNDELHDHSRDRPGDEHEIDKQSGPITRMSNFKSMYNTQAPSNHHQNNKGENRSVMKLVEKRANIATHSNDTQTNNQAAKGAQQSSYNMESHHGSAEIDNGAGGQENDDMKKKRSPNKPNQYIIYQKDNSPGKRANYSKDKISNLQVGYAKHSSGEQVINGVNAPVVRGPGRQSGLSSHNTQNDSMMQRSDHSHQTIEGYATIHPTNSSGLCNNPTIVNSNHNYLNSQANSGKKIQIGAMKGSPHARSKAPSQLVHMSKQGSGYNNNNQQLQQVNTSGSLYAMQQSSKNKLTNKQQEMLALQQQNVGKKVGELAKTKLPSIQIQQSNRKQKEIFAAASSAMSSERKKYKTVENQQFEFKPLQNITGIGITSQGRSNSPNKFNSTHHSVLSQNQDQENLREHTIVSPISDHQKITSKPSTHMTMVGPNKNFNNKNQSVMNSFTPSQNQVLVNKTLIKGTNQGTLSPTSQQHQQQFNSVVKTFDKTLQSSLQQKQVKPIQHLERNGPHPNQTKNISNLSYTDQHSTERALSSQIVQYTNSPNHGGGMSPRGVVSNTARNYNRKGGDAPNYDFSNAQVSRQQNVKNSPTGAKKVKLQDFSNQKPLRPLQPEAQQPKQLTLDNQVNNATKTQLRSTTTSSKRKQGGSGLKKHSKIYMGNIYLNGGHQEQPSVKNGSQIPDFIQQQHQMFQDPIYSMKQPSVLGNMSRFKEQQERFYQFSPVQMAAFFNQQMALNQQNNHLMQYQQRDQIGVANFDQNHSINEKHQQVMNMLNQDMANLLVHQNQGNNKKGQASPVKYQNSTTTQQHLKMMKQVSPLQNAFYSGASSGNGHNSQSARQQWIAANWPNQHHNLQSMTHGQNSLTQGIYQEILINNNSSQQISSLNSQTLKSQKTKEFIINNVDKNYMKETNIQKLIKHQQSILDQSRSSTHQVLIDPDQEQGQTQMGSGSQGMQCTENNIRPLSKISSQRVGDMDKLKTITEVPSMLQNRNNIQTREGDHSDHGQGEDAGLQDELNKGVFKDQIPTDHQQTFDNTPSKNQHQTLLHYSPSAKNEDGEFLLVNNQTQQDKKLIDNSMQQKLSPQNSQKSQNKNHEKLLSEGGQKGVSGSHKDDKVVLSVVNSSERGKMSILTSTKRQSAEQFAEHFIQDLSMNGGGTKDSQAMGMQQQQQQLNSNVNVVPQGGYGNQMNTTQQQRQVFQQQAHTGGIQLRPFMPSSAFTSKIKEKKSSPQANNPNPGNSRLCIKLPGDLQSLILKSKKRNKYNHNQKNETMLQLSSNQISQVGVKTSKRKLMTHKQLTNDNLLSYQTQLGSGAISPLNNPLNQSKQNARAALLQYQASHGSNPKQIVLDHNLASSSGDRQGNEDSFTFDNYSVGSKDQLNLLATADNASFQKLLYLQEQSSHKNAFQNMVMLNQQDILDNMLQMKVISPFALQSSRQQQAFRNHTLDPDKPKHGLSLLEGSHQYYPEHFLERIVTPDNPMARLIKQHNPLRTPLTKKKRWDADTLICKFPSNTATSNQLKGATTLDVFSNSTRLQSLNKGGQQEQYYSPKVVSQHKRQRNTKNNPTQGGNLQGERQQPESNFTEASQYNYPTTTSHLQNYHLHSNAVDDATSGYFSNNLLQTPLKNIDEQEKDGMTNQEGTDKNNKMEVDQQDKKVVKAFDYVVLASSKIRQEQYKDVLQNQEAQKLGNKRNTTNISDLSSFLKQQKQFYDRQINEQEQLISCIGTNKLQNMKPYEYIKKQQKAVILSPPQTTTSTARDKNFDVTKSFTSSNLQNYNFNQKNEKQFSPKRNENPKIISNKRTALISVSQSKAKMLDEQPNTLNLNQGGNETQGAKDKVKVMKMHVNTKKDNSFAYSTQKPNILEESSPISIKSTIEPLQTIQTQNQSYTSRVIIEKRAQTTDHNTKPQLKDQNQLLNKKSKDLSDPSAAIADFQEKKKVADQDPLLNMAHPAQISGENKIDELLENSGSKQDHNDKQDDIKTQGTNESQRITQSIF